MSEFSAEIIEVLCKSDQLSLVEIDEGLYSWLLDAEGDPYYVKFNYDDCAFIDTEGFSYFTPYSSDLIALGELVREADERYKVMFDEEGNGQCIQ